MSQEDNSNPEIRQCWDYEFCWTPYHRTAHELKPLRYSFDTVAAKCLGPLQSIALSNSGNSPREATTFGDTPAEDNELHEVDPCIWKEDMFALLRDNHHKDVALAKLWEQVNTIPDWVDWDQIGRGQQVFYRYGLSMIVALIFQSLLGGMGAGNTVETLSRTGGFSAKVVLRRLLETAQHTLHVTQSLDSIRPGGVGHASTIRVRLLHAAVRNRIIRLSDRRPGYYSVEKHGIPINDLDSIGTICAFSATVIWIGLPRQGIYLKKQECEDYVALWRLVAYYIGAPTEVFETLQKARATMESILLAEVVPTRTSGVLARNMIIGLENTPPLFAPRGVLEAMARLLNGRTLSDKLGLGNPGLLSWFIVWWILCHAWLWGHIGRIIPQLDSMQIRINKKRFRSQVMDAKTGLGRETKFDFKYVPNL